MASPGLHFLRVHFILQRGKAALSPHTPALRKLHPGSSGRCWVYRVIRELSTITSYMPWESWLRGHYFCGAHMGEQLL